MTGIYPDIPAVFYVCNRKMDRQLLWFSDIVQCITETAKWKYPVLSDSLCFQFSALKGFTVAVGDTPIDFCGENSQAGRNRGEYGCVRQDCTVKAGNGT